MNPLQRDLLLALDPVVFAKETLGITPDPWQAKVLRYAGKRLILNCSRQSGKSLTASIKALHRAIFSPRSLVLLISPSLRQSSELFRVVSDLTKKIEPMPRRIEDNRLSMTLENHSRIVSLPSKEETVRGYASVDMIIEDEASRVDDELFFSIRPMLATSGGALILMSTPFGRRGHFYDIYTGSGDRLKDGWERVEVEGKDCPRISKEFLQEEKLALGEWWFSQEYECEFVESEAAVFGVDYLEAAMTDEFKIFPGGE